VARIVGVIKRTEYPAGVPCWVDTNQSDPGAAARFYEGLFGWDTTDILPPEAPGRYLVAGHQGLLVAGVGSQPSPDRAPAWNTYIAVDDADATAAKVEAAGGEVVVEPFDDLTAGRKAECVDPAGARFVLWQARDHKGAESVNAPNTWNWSNLETSDPEGAAAFYGKVFGWQAIQLGPGGPIMWSRPGYGDFLEEKVEPGLRERQTQGGAPAGFENAIGWLAASENGSANWSVTFAVEDVDELADRAVALDGTVKVAPFSVPNARIAVLSDAEGATFTVSAYSPE